MRHTHKNDPVIFSVCSDPALPTTHRDDEAEFIFEYFPGIPQVDPDNNGVPPFTTAHYPVGDGRCSDPSIHRLELVVHFQGDDLTDRKPRDEVQIALKVDALCGF